jgi:Na+/melibiose symporter-like transporter
MTFLVLKFLHVGSMFLATALALGPSVLLYLIARTEDVGAIRRAFGHARAVFRLGGAFYGLGLLFGFIAALTGQLDLTQSWLVTAYVLVGVLIATNLVFERWTRRIEQSVTTSEKERSADLSEVIRARTPLYALVGMATLTLIIVFVMVVKPTLFG